MIRIKYIIVSIIFLMNFMFYSKSFSKEGQYQAVFNPLKCRGVASVNDKIHFSEWKFYPIGGSGAEIDIRFNGDKRLGRIRTSVYENGDLYGRGKWIGRTAAKTYNTLVTIKFDYATKNFLLVSDFNPTIFRLNGKCK